MLERLLFLKRFPHFKYLLKNTPKDATTQGRITMIKNKTPSPFQVYAQ